MHRRMLWGLISGQALHTDRSGIARNQFLPVPGNTPQRIRRFQLIGDTGSEVGDVLYPNISWHTLAR